MDRYLQEKLKNDKAFKKYLDENTNYLKYLNRDSSYHQEFMRLMKDKYKERTTDKINNAVKTINVISSIIETIK